MLQSFLIKMLYFFLVHDHLSIMYDINGSVYYYPMTYTTIGKFLISMIAILVLGILMYYSSTNSHS